MHLSNIKFHTDVTQFLVVLDTLPFGITLPPSTLNLLPLLWRGGALCCWACRAAERKVAAGANYRPQTQARELLVGASLKEPL